MMFTVERSIQILERTPEVLGLLLQDISDDWTSNNEGGESWSVYDVIGHLIHGEETDWIPRIEIILSEREDKTFRPFDRFAQLSKLKTVPLKTLVDKFKTLRKKNIERLRSKSLTEKMLQEKGIHPALGEVTLAQLIATWVVHDLDHLSQISRVMAKQYKSEVGAWSEYLKILKQ